MTEYLVTKTVTYTLVVSAKTPQEATILADTYPLDSGHWEAYTFSTDVESQGPVNEEIDEY